MEIERILNALVIIIITAILLSAFGVQLIMHEEPCPLCFLQRLGMLSVGSSLLLNLWFGIRPSHYGLALLSSIIGGSVALRQISLHACPGVPAFGIPILGLSLYTWSFLIFTCCILAVAILLFLYNPKKSGEIPGRFSYLEKAACALLFFSAAANILSAFLQCGLGPCVE